MLEEGKRNIEVCLVEEGEGRKAEELKLSLWEEGDKRRGGRRFCSRVVEKESEQHKTELETGKSDPKYEKVHDL